MILLFTDFGTAGPYVGQMRAVLTAAAPDVPVIDLMHDAPAFRPREAGYLLAALVRHTPADAVLLAVVDPGVGTERRPIVLRVGTRWLVGPDNGLFAPTVRQALEDSTAVDAWCITWRPPDLSASFHGRDLFAPVAAALARGGPIPGDPIGPESLTGARDWPLDLPAIIYIDGYGNAMSGLRACCIPASARIRVGEQVLNSAETFAAVPRGVAFWYENSSGLVEIAVNQRGADSVLALAVGSSVDVVPASSAS